MRLLRTISLLGLFGAAGCLWAQGPVLHSFETPADLQQISAPPTTSYALTKKSATEGKSALQVTFNPATWSKILFTNPTPLDASQYYGYALDVTNPTNETIQFGVRIDDSTSADGYYHCRTATIVIRPNAKEKYLVPFFPSPNPEDSGMFDLPKTYAVIPGLKLAYTRGAEFDASHIVCYQIFIYQPKTPETLIFDNIRLVPKPKTATVINPTDLNKLVDEFGQYTRTDWPGKIKSVDDLLAARRAEDADLRAHPALRDRDEYGGWTKGPQLKATGFFRTEKVKGKWWLVDPLGHLFFSVGIDGMQNDAESTVTEGRESMFSWLPAKDDPLYRCVGSVWNVYYRPGRPGATMNFLQANLIRKYGTDFQPAYLDRANRRLSSWGFNTVGNWSDAAFRKNNKVPYVVGPQPSPAKAPCVDKGQRMLDPFDPLFLVEVRRVLTAGEIASNDDNPYCIGYFFGNEEDWGNTDGGDESHYFLSMSAMKNSADTSAAKRVFLADLQQKYTDIAKFNAAWGTKFTSWDDLRAPYTFPSTMTAGCQADLSAFLKTFANEYFRIVRDEIKKVSPHHLYLGGRFVAWCPPEVTEAAAANCDVVSFNIYQPRVDPQRWAYLNKLNKPFLVGEYHFGAVDRGMFSTGMMSAASQQERAQMFAEYVRSVVDNPTFVGCHWYQYNDQPITGRLMSGENYNIGFITSTDTPYSEMVNAARIVHQEMYERRYGKGRK